MLIFAPRPARRATAGAPDPPTSAGSGRRFRVTTASSSTRAKTAPAIRRGELAPPPRVPRPVARHRDPHAERARAVVGDPDLDRLAGEGGSPVLEPPGAANVTGDRVIGGGRGDRAEERAVARLCERVEDAGLVAAVPDPDRIDRRVGLAGIRGRFRDPMVLLVSCPSVTRMIIPFRMCARCMSRAARATPS